jgi:hypothetical protein
LLYCVETTSAKLYQKKKTVRNVAGEKYNANSAPIFVELKILPYDKIHSASQLQPSEKTALFSFSFSLKFGMNCLLI